MKTSDFSFELPARLIAQHPVEKRGHSRLMLLNRKTGSCTHHMVSDLPQILCQPEFVTDAGLPLLVFNNSKVRKARLIGTSLDSGAQVEFLLLSPDLHFCIWKVLVKRAKRRKPGSAYAFYNQGGQEIARALITGKEGECCLLEFDRCIDDEWLDHYGQMPLPPYIKRQDSAADADRYQTVYAAKYGSSAAPTAGLHFTPELLGRLEADGIETAFLTLHVGLGTFLPVRTEHIEDHTMHEERFSIDEQCAVKIERAKMAGRKIIAVGTTVVRSLESAWDNDSLAKGGHSTSIFLYPGCRFNVTDALFTNFHTPESTLLMLVAAFAGKDLILQSYAEAIREDYRFFSYGDAMLIV